MKRRQQRSSVDYWMSYSDLMAGLLMVFILMLVGSIIAAKHDIEVQKAELEESRLELEEAKQELYSLHVGVGDILGVRAQIIERLRKRFADRGGDLVFDDATGAISLGTSILFDEGSDRLRKPGQERLKELLPIYFEALLGDPKLRVHVGQIVFEGHSNSNFSGSDPKAAYLFNLQLSQARAYSVMQFVFREDLAKGYQIESVLAANGYSSSRPVFDGEGLEDKERSRRLELRFRLKDEEAIRELDHMFRKSP
ncbi:OmpA family protein [Microvenator marinus]|uniref:OmpA family protein n=1 Tax=Microvenator marinus TaxID=2600177 RepID=A0A5B8XYD9_9DELT|nr:OmpA family protein [Microvenator marinus]QED28449.1 OmpA family protein [Microvenator marinus]